MGFILAKPAEKVLSVGVSTAYLSAHVAKDFKGLYQKNEGPPELEICAVPCTAN